MRILIAAPFLGPTGAPAALLHLVRGLAPRHAIEVMRAEAPEGPLAGHFRAAGARIIAPAAMAGRYDVALAVTIAAARAVQSLAPRMPVAWWILEAQMARTWLDGMPAAAGAFAAATETVFLADHQVALFEPWLAARRWSTVPLGIPVDGSARPSPYPAGTRGFRVLQIGTVTPYKAQDVTLAALAGIGRPAVAAYLVGGEGVARYRAGLDRMLARDPALAARVHFLGPRDPADLAGYLQHADVLVMPSRDEVSPLAIVEAMAHGLPVIATGLPAMREFLADGVNAVLIPVDDPAGLAAAIRRLQDDPSLRARLAAAARSTVAARFGLERHVAAMEEVLARVAGRRGEARA
ncbi:MAG: glycosyltransferase family 4 protein [Alphaproteobacteria bacterium]